LLSLPSAVPIVGHTGEHDISSMLFGVFVLYGSDWSNGRLLRGRGRLPSRQRRQKAVSLGDPSEPVAVPGGVVRRLHAAVELARTIESMLVRESRQPVGLAAFLALGWRLPFWLLVFDCRHLPACGSRLHGLALVVAWLLAPTGVASRGPRSLRGHFARCINLDFFLHGGVGRGIFICYDQQLVEGRRLIIEKSVLEEGALSAPGGEVLDGLHLVHGFARVAELGPA